MLLDSCATFPSGTISSAPVYYPEKPTMKAEITPVPVTFSLQLNNEYGSDAWVSQGQIAAAIQHHLQQSGLFSEVDCVPVQQAGRNHLAFSAKLSGRPKAERLGIMILGGMTLATIPTWTTLHLQLSATEHNRGKARHNWQTAQDSTEILWAPLALAAPFCDRRAARRKMLGNAMNSLLDDMRADNRTQHRRN